MGEWLVKTKVNLGKIIDEELRPNVKRVDTEAFYARDYLRKLGEEGFFFSRGKSERELLLDGMYVVEETAKVCMTTAFCVWCHLAALTYLRKTKNEVLKNKLLPLLEAGTIIGATGLSNPMKYYAGLENLHLQARRVEGGFIVSGVLPAVSNLCESHWFGVIAGVDEATQIMGFIPCDIEGLKRQERTEFFGANGSATYSCQFKDVFIPDQWILSERACEFAKEIRSAFVSYQISLGLGVTHASVLSMEKVRQRQNGCNRFLKGQPEELREEQQNLRRRLDLLMSKESIDWKEVANIRLQTAYLTLKAVQTSMLHHGSAGYTKNCDPARRLREAYFFANLTPTIKHLEKELAGN